VDAEQLDRERPRRIERRSSSRCSSETRCGAPGVASNQRSRSSSCSALSRSGPSSFPSASENAVDHPIHNRLWSSPRLACSRSRAHTRQSFCVSAESRSPAGHASTLTDHLLELGSQTAATASRSAGAIKKTGEASSLAATRVSPPAVSGRRRNVEDRRCPTDRAAACDPEHKLPAPGARRVRAWRYGESASGPPSGRRRGRRTARKEDRITSSAVHNQCRRDN
jgi:hypothetical protein